MAWLIISVQAYLHTLDTNCRFNRHLCAGILVGIDQKVTVRPQVVVQVHCRKEERQVLTFYKLNKLLANAGILHRYLLNNIH